MAKRLNEYAGKSRISMWSQSKQIEVKSDWIDDEDFGRPYIAGLIFSSYESKVILEASLLCKLIGTV